MVTNICMDDALHSYWFLEQLLPNAISFSVSVSKQLNYFCKIVVWVNMQFSTALDFLRTLEKEKLELMIPQT